MPSIRKKKEKNNNILSNYLERQKHFVPDIPLQPSIDLHFCIVVPCYNEPDIVETINSLKNNILPKKDTEVIVVVNSPEYAIPEILEQNKQTISILNNWQNKNNSSHFSLHYIHTQSIPVKLAGAGYARKRGMDEAIYRLNLVNNPDGIIISIDADTICAEDYLKQIEQFYEFYPRATGCNINFEHKLENIEDRNLKNAVAQYELYLRYFVEAIRITGFPHAFHTIGSCFTIKAVTYCKQGGMNTRQAGEDFYFLQKVFFLGDFYELNSNVVYPSARISNRVVFGTGPAIQKIYNEEDRELMVYSFESIMLFKDFFNCVKEYYINSNGTIKILDRLPQSFLNYLDDSKVLQKLKEINNNVASEKEFHKRLFQYFNNFFIVKGLNYLHKTTYTKVTISDAVRSLVHYLKKEQIDNIYDMLTFLRNLQKSRPVILQQ